MEDQQLMDVFTRELIELEESGAGLPFVFSPSQAWYLLANLQLALRHPGNTGSAAAFARELGENIQSRLCKGRPAMAEIAQRGWNA
mgnify:CR=1 FL=1